MTQLTKSDFYFDLPENLIAQDPLADRSSSRLLALNKESGEFRHRIFKDVIDYCKCPQYYKLKKNDPNTYNLKEAYDVALHK